MSPADSQRPIQATSFITGSESLASGSRIESDPATESRKASPFPFSCYDILAQMSPRSVFSQSLVGSNRAVVATM